MQKVKDRRLTLYEEIEEIKKRRTRLSEEGATCPTCPTQDVLTLCNNSDNYKSPYKSSTSQGRLSDQKPTPKQDPCPVADPDPVPKTEAVAERKPEAHKWSVADCPTCLCYVVWANYPLGGGTRYFCGYGPIVLGKSKKVELIRLGECPAGGVIPKAAEARQSPSVCYFCHGNKWWVSIYDVRICATCYPPGAARLVKDSM